MLFDDVYLVSKKLDIVTEQDIVAAERILGVSLPQAYHAFMTKLGKGVYCDLVLLFSPEGIVAEYARAREQWMRNVFWNSSGQILSQDQLRASVILAHTLEGDHIILCPDRPDTLFVLPHGDTVIYWCPDGFHDLTNWVSQRGLERAPATLKYFRPFRDRQDRLFRTDLESVVLPILVQSVKNLWQRPIAHEIHEEYEDSSDVLLFVPSISGIIQFTQEAFDEGFMVNISVNYDPDNLEDVNTLSDVLKKLGFYEAL